jgi:PAS domain S-box-containing protein
VVLSVVVAWAFTIFLFAIPIRAIRVVPSIENGRNLRSKCHSTSAFSFGICVLSETKSTADGWSKGKMNAKRTSKVLSVVGFCIGVAALLGWIFGIETLKRVHPALVTMKVNTAIGLILTGAAVWLSSEEEPRPFRLHLARVLAFVVVIGGALTFSESVFGVNLGIDQVFFQESDESAVRSFPGRMGPASALIFMLLGAAVLMIDVQIRRRWWPAQWCVVTGTAITLAIFLTYSYGLGKLGPLARYASIALHATVAFLCLFVAIVLARPDRGLAAELSGSNLGAIAARRLLPVALLSPVLIGWLLVAGLNAGWYDGAAVGALFATIMVVVLTVMIWRTARELDRAEQARYQLSAIVDSSDDAILSKDLNGVIASWNAGAQRLFGYTAAEMIGQPITKIIPAERQDEEAGILRRLRAGERIEHFETLRRTKDGRLVDVSLTISPVRDAAGRIIGASKIARDVTERRKYEEELRVARDAAEAASRAKDDFLAILSHELRTPLSPVLMLAAEMEHSADIPPAIRTDFATIRKNVELEARLIDDLLDLTRITKGKLSLRFSDVDAHLVLRHALDILHKDIQAKQIAVSVDFAAKNRHVTADAVRLQQVFLNVLKNAVKFNEPRGKITIRTWDEEERLRISVTDTGLGITEEEMPRIFDAFAQGIEAALPRFGGLGLGLSISAILVREHGGRIWAESPGRHRGACLQIELPSIPAVAESSADLDASVLGTHRAARILLVEDHVATRETLARLLARRGHQVERAGSVAQAIEVANHSEFDLIISDLGLPDGSGRDLMLALQEKSHVPAIALSGYGMKSDIEESKAAGFDEHFTKPVNISQLEDAIDKVLRVES